MIAPAMSPRPPALCAVCVRRDATTHTTIDDRLYRACVECAVPDGVEVDDCEGPRDASAAAAKPSAPLSMAPEMVAQRERRDRRVREGLCINCEAPTNGTRQCARCHDRQLAYQRASAKRSAVRAAARRLR